MRTILKLIFLVSAITCNAQFIVNPYIFGTPVNNITYFGSSSNPSDNGDYSASLATLTPPTSMIAGDLVILSASVKSSVQDPTINTGGGQTWNSLTVHQVSGIGSIKIFWCKFNGTWSANPIVAMGTSATTIVVMHVFRPTYPYSLIDLDVAPVQTSHSAATTITAPEITTLGTNTLAFSLWASGDDNTWGNISGTGWNVLGSAQYRNTNGSDGSLSFAYKTMSTAGGTGTVSKDQLTLGADAAATQICSFRFRLPIPGNTSNDNFRVILGIGDSNSSGVGESVPVVSSGTLYFWNGTSYDEITTQDVDNDPDIGDVYGSLYQQYATDYKLNTGKKTVLVNEALGGTTVVSGWNDNPGSSFDQWDIAVRNANLAINYIGVREVGLGICHLPINDLRLNDNTIAEINTAVDDLLDRWSTTFPGVPLHWTTPGRANLYVYNARHYGAIKNLIEESQARPWLFLSGQGLSFYGSGNMQGDNLHYNQAGLNILGAMNVKLEANTNISNKWIRSIISSLHDDPSSSRKTLLQNFVNGLITRSNYFTLEYLSLFQTTTLGNACMDLTFLGGSYGVGSPTFTANADIQTNGTSSYVATTFNPNWCTRAASQDDIFFGVYVSEVNTSGACTLFGLNDGDGLELRQTASGLEYRVNRTAYRALNGTFLQAGHWYFVARNGTTQYLIRDTTIIDSVSAASEGLPNAVMFLGGLNDTPPTSFGDFRFKAAIGGKYSDFDLNNFVSDHAAYMSGW